MVWVEPHIRVIRGLSGESIGRSVFMIDVTERRKAQEARDALRRRIDNVIASIPGAVWEAAGGAATGLGQITFVSPFITAMIGYRPDEIVDHPEIWAQITHLEDAERVASETAELCKNGGGSLRHRWITKDGRVIWVETHIRVTSSEGRAPASACSRARVAIIDITGVPHVDARTADALIRAALAVRMLGAEVVLTGTRPEVARTLVALDSGLQGIVTRGTLESGIGYATRTRVK